MKQTSLECLFLSEEDLKNAGALDMDACVNVMEDACLL